jgi:ABC-type sugar transport system permease subunit
VVYGLVIIDGFRIFDLVFVTTKNGPANATIVMATYNYMLAFGDFLCGYAAALSNINVVVILIISVFYFHFSMRSNID